MLRSLRYSEMTPRTGFRQKYISGFTRPGFFDLFPGRLHA